MPTRIRKSAETLTADEVELLRAYITKHGFSDAEERLHINRATIMRALASVSINRGSAALVRGALFGDKSGSRPLALA